MAIDKAVKVPERTITSLDIVSFDGGRDERVAQSADTNTFVHSRNAIVTSQGLITQRQGLKRFLPDTVETVYQVFPALYNGQMYYITADDGKVKYCQRNDTTWTDCGGANTITTTDVVNTFLRIQDKVLILNGTDKLQYVDLANFDVIKFVPVTDPANAPTAAPTGITGTGDFKLYYGITFNSTVGETKLGPILTQAVSKSRTQWKDDGSEYLTISRNNTSPSNAVSWNLYMSLAPAGAVIAVTDMLLLGSGIDLATNKFVDNGTIPINLSHGTAPEDNSTDGPQCAYGIETNGRPILWGSPDGYTLSIGGDGDYPLDFTPNNGGFTLPLNKGTNYFPISVIGFRNGQGIPSLTVLFSNTEGLSKQSIIEQQTITYGKTSFVVWSVTEQNYGASGVASPYGVVNYQGALIFPSADGIMSMDTQASLQNVLQTKRISDRVDATFGSINSQYLPKVVGTAWGDSVYLSVPSRGYAFNNEILVYDVTNKDKPKWYSLDIQAQWIGVISPSNATAFVYVCQDNHIFYLEDQYVAMDELPDGTTGAFPIEVTGSITGLNQAHNSYMAIVQAVFYLVDVIGTVQLSVTYADGNKDKLKTKIVTIGGYKTGGGGGWSDYQFQYQSDETVWLEWSGQIISQNTATPVKTTRRVPIALGGIITNEIQWAVNVDSPNSSFKLRTVSYQGINIGVKADLM